MMIAKNDFWILFVYCVLTAKGKLNEVSNGYVLWCVNGFLSLLNHYWIEILEEYKHGVNAKNAASKSILSMDKNV